MRILVVDDSLPMRLLIKKTLKEIGYVDLVLSDSAQNALEILGNESFDLILLDWHMPEMNGFKLLQHLKNADDLKHIPVIMLTGEGDVANVTRAIDNGAEGYILKPVNRELLLVRLKDIESNHILGLRK